MKNGIVLMILYLLPLRLAAEEINALMLHLTSNQEIVCVLDENPVITFEGNELILTTHKNVVKYSTKDIRKFTYFYYDSSSINKIETKPGFVITGDVLKACGLEPNSSISIYSVDGKLLVTDSVDKTGSASIVLPLQRGKIFVVKTSVANFKISKP